MARSCPNSNRRTAMMEGLLSSCVLGRESSCQRIGNQGTVGPGHLRPRQLLARRILTYTPCRLVSLMQHDCRKLLRVFLWKISLPSSRVTHFMRMPEAERLYRLLPTRTKPLLRLVMRAASALLGSTCGGSLNSLMKSIN